MATLPHPGTTALSSPEGFEEEYAALRKWRKSSGKPLVHLWQLESTEPAVAARLRERVNFDVPTTVGKAVSTFFGHPTAQFICCALALSLAGRCRLGVRLSFADLAAAVATAIFWTVQEWVIHDKLLHSKEPWFGETVHRWHHELPYYHVSLDGIGLASVWFASVGVVLLSIGMLTSTLAPCITALAAYTFCGGLYEAAHYLAHTRVPLPLWLNEMRRHHTQHHTLDHKYWLAFIVPAVDNLFGTNPPPRQVRDAMRQMKQQNKNDVSLATDAIMLRRRR